jgi:hypothetical protein
MQQSRRCAIPFSRRNDYPKLPTPTTQVQRIVAKFGGVPQLHAALRRLAYFTGREEIERSLPSIYRWEHPKARNGAGGMVPSSAVRDVQAAARLSGVVLTAKDWEPHLGELLDTGLPPLATHCLIAKLAGSAEPV